MDYWVQTPDGKIKAQYVGDHTLPVPYTAKLDAVLHHALAKFHLPESVTKAGHSGSPVLTEEAGGKLVGMHIIGDVAARISLVIPAWRLLDPECYGVSGEQWQLWPGP